MGQGLQNRPIIRLTGAQSIRAYGLQTKFIETSEMKIDINQKSSYAGTIANRLVKHVSYSCIERVLVTKLRLFDSWFCVRLNLLSAVIVFFAALFAVLGRNTINAALIGLSITYALQVGIIKYKLVSWIT